MVGHGATSSRRAHPYRRIHQHLRWYLLAWDTGRLTHCCRPDLPRGSTVAEADADGRRMPRYAATTASSPVCVERAALPCDQPRGCGR
ncbi:WYL domain-containing protein [Nocardia grenadensis]